MLAKALCQSPNLSTEPPSSGASPLPHLFLCCLEDQAGALACLRIVQTLHNPPVGAGLPAKAQCQSPNLSTESPSSGASPLPHLFCVVWKIRPAHLPAYALFKPCTKPLWERACSRKSSVSHRIYRLNHRLRGQAPSHICFVLFGRSSSTLACLRVVQTLHKALWELACLR